VRSALTKCPPAQSSGERQPEAKVSRPATQSHFITHSSHQPCSNWSFASISVHSPQQTERGAVAGVLQRKCAACETEEEEKLSRKALDGPSPRGGLQAPPVVNAALAESGQPLALGTREFFESAFRADFSKVRIHSSAQAAEAAERVRAKAFYGGPRCSVWCQSICACNLGLIALVSARTGTRGATGPHPGNGAICLQNDQFTAGPSGTRGRARVRRDGAGRPRFSHRGEAICADCARPLRPRWHYERRRHQGRCSGSDRAADAADVRPVPQIPFRARRR
jgi:hypothetical protein